MRVVARSATKVEAVPAVVTREDFRTVMSEVPTAVSVVTAFDRGRAHATTVSAFCSLSLEPPLVMLALDRRSDLLAILSEGGSFAINVLSSSQSDISERCARKGAGKLEDIEWILDAAAPRITGCAAFTACEVASMFDGGDHVIVIGRVVRVDVGPSEPLLYHRRAYHRPHPLKVRR